MSESFDLKVVGGSRAAIVRVTGRVDARSAPQMLARCAEARAKGGHLVLNLEGVTFLSSSGVGALLALAEQAREDGGTLRLANLSVAVSSPLKMLNLDQFLKIDASERDALSALEAA